MSLQNAPLRLFSLDEFHRLRQVGLLAPDERVELVEGQVVAMAPFSADHALTVTKMSRLLAAALGSGAAVRSQEAFSAGPTCELNPDLVVGSPAPLLVIEVSTRQSLLYDQEEKASLYARAGVPEYWLVDLEGRRLQVHRKPGKMRRRPWGHGYYEARFLEAGASVPLPAPLPSAPELGVADLF